MSPSNNNNSIDPVKVKPSWFWIKGSGGQASVSTTLVVIAFLVTTLAYLSSIFTNIGPLNFRSFDTAAAGVYLVPLLTLYFGRRYTESSERIKGTNGPSNNGVQP